MGFAVRRKEIQLQLDFIRDREHFVDYAGFCHVKLLKYDPEVRLKDARIIQFPFIRINFEKISVIHVDVDYPYVIGPYDPIEGFDPTFYERNLLPLPNTVVATSRGFHASWFLEKPLPYKCSERSLSFFRDVRAKIVFALGGDSACSVNVAARSPFYKEAKVLRFTERRFSLDELNLPLKIPAHHYRHYGRQFVQGNRNSCMYSYLCGVFHVNGKTHSEEDLFAAGQRFQSLYPEVPPLDRQELAGIVRSVIHRSRYGFLPSDERKNRGALGLERIRWRELGEEGGKEEIRHRQSLGANHTHAKRKESTLQRLRVALEEMQAKGENVTILGLAKASGVARNTVKAHWQALTGEVRE